MVYFFKFENLSTNKWSSILPSAVFHYSLLRGRKNTTTKGAHSFEAALEMKKIGHKKS